MGSTGVKEYTLKINGLSQNVKDVTTLDAAVKALDESIKKMGKSDGAGAGVSRQKAAALSDEEKAAKKLEDTQKRVAEADSEANRAQIAATQELRERTREITRQVAAEQLAEGSIKAMGMQLTDLRNEYEALSAAEREEEGVGGALLEQIQALDSEYKALRESTGNFRDSVGNYEKALAGLDEVKEGFERAATSSTDLATNVLGSSDVLDAFGETAESAATSTGQLSSVVNLASTAQEVYTAVVKEGWIENKAAAVIDTVRTVQLKAKTAAEALSTKGTIAATIAQRIFNLVANANPYVLLAVALITVIGALVLFANKTSDAAEEQKRLNDLQEIELDNLERAASKLTEVGNIRIKSLQDQIAVLTAAGAKTKDIRALEDQLFSARLSNNAKQRGFYADEIKNLDANKKKLAELYHVLMQLQNARALGIEKTKIDIDLDGKIDKVKVEDAITSVQAAVDALGRTVKVAVDLGTEQDDIKQEIEVAKATRLKADADLAKERAKKEKERAKQRYENEKGAVRAEEDARISLTESSYEKQRATIEATYDRQIADLKHTLATEKNLTDAARKALNENIVNQDKLRAKDLLKLNEDVAAKELETYRQLEDQRTALLIGAADRQRAEINIKYDRQIEDLNKRLAKEKDLTENQRIELNEMVENYEKQRNQDLNIISAQGAQQRANQELTALDFMLEKANNAIGEFTKRNKTGLKLIDVPGTRANLAAANKALSEYVTSLGQYDKDLKAAHEGSLATLKAGTPEYVDELQKYAAAHESVTQRIKKAQKEQADNTKESNRTQIEYYKDLFSKISDYAQIGSELIGSAFSTWNQGLQMQVDALNSQLEDLDEKYEESKKLSEDSAKHVEDLEGQIQDATGGTATALKEQLADAMRARNDAARNEQQLQKEKEKKQEEIAKKEKKMKRNEILGGIATSIANTAQGVTKGLSLGFPLGLVVAGIIAALGAIQVGIMVKQLTKLADGGPIIGPSHAGGGVNIGLGYEAEGGEYVTNKRSYAANRNLVEFINASNGSITAADLAGVLPGDNTGSPVIVTDAAQAGEDRIVDAIESIDLRPVVAVTDIMDVQDQVTTVRDLSGF